jgi:hypothetical protein
MIVAEAFAVSAKHIKAMEESIIKPEDDLILILLVF